jgi:hypothetical protein
MQGLAIFTSYIVMSFCSMSLAACSQWQENIVAVLRATNLPNQHCVSKCRGTTRSVIVRPFDSLQSMFQQSQQQGLLEASMAGRVPQWSPTIKNVLQHERAYQTISLQPSYLHIFGKGGKGNTGRQVTLQWRNRK